MNLNQTLNLARGKIDQPPFKKEKSDIFYRAIMFYTKCK